LQLSLLLRGLRGLLLRLLGDGVLVTLLCFDQVLHVADRSGLQVLGVADIARVQLAHVIADRAHVVMLLLLPLLLRLVRLARDLQRVRRTRLVLLLLLLAGPEQVVGRVPGLPGSDGRLDRVLVGEGVARLQADLREELVHNVARHLVHRDIHVHALAALREDEWVGQIGNGLKTVSVTVSGKRFSTG
jgi:hypothetical protein